MSELLKDTTANTIGTGSGGLKLEPSIGEVVTIGNGVMLPDGTKTEPAIRFADDNNTGIYSPVNDQVVITGHGEDALVVTGVSSSVNVVEVKPSVTGSPVEINATGTDTNVSVNVTPKGTGTLKVAGTDVSLSTHDHTLDGLSDVTITTPASGHVISYNGSAWVNGAPTGGEADVTISSIATNTTATNHTTYMLTASLVLTLPASPTAGNWVRFSNRSGTLTSTIARNGSNIMGAAEDMTLDDLNARGTLAYTGATQGWVLINE